MANLTGGSFKRISPEDIRVRQSSLNQLVDVIQEDISGSATRRHYSVFVTGGIGPGITSSLYHTVHDQDFSLQTSNPIFDVTVGLFPDNPHVTNATTQTVAGKALFKSNHVMVREKTDVYKQYASTLLGNSATAFYAPYNSTVATKVAGVKKDQIDEALFLSFKRLFSRDSIKRETFAIRLNRSASYAGVGHLTDDKVNASNWTSAHDQTNLFTTSELGSAIFTDMGAASNQIVAFGGNVGNLVNAANPSEYVGLVFYDHGTVVLDMNKVFWSDQPMSGTINAIDNTTTFGTLAGQVVLGGPSSPNAGLTGSFIPDFVMSASIDNILDHVSSTRFQSGTFTAATFQNVTKINSTLVFCRATADEFNYSTNPSFTSADGRIRMVDMGQEGVQRSFTFPTTVGLHDEFGNLLAVAKTSRPIEKNDEKDITFRVRLDF